MMRRNNEYFGENRNLYPDHCISNVPPKLFRQERDWSCSIACIRSLLSGTDVSWTENYLIEKFNMSPGPYYSKDYKAINIFPQTLDVILGCDNPDITVKRLFQYMEDGYYIMAETMYNYAHWYVILGYYLSNDENNPEHHTIVAYDPYYDEIRLVNADEFETMWLDGDHANNHILKDFIAIRQ